MPETCPASDSGLHFRVPCVGPDGKTAYECLYCKQPMDAPRESPKWKFEPFSENEGGD